MQLQEQKSAAYAPETLPPGAHATARLLAVMPEVIIMAGIAPGKNGRTVGRQNGEDGEIYAAAPLDWRTE